MLWIVAYDIVDDGRRARVHRFLTASGIAAQRSVFVCDLTATRLRALRDGLQARIDPGEDQVRAYPLCAGCASKTELFGDRAELENHGGFLVV